MPEKLKTLKKPTKTLQTIPALLQTRLTKYKIDKFFDTDQAVIRVALNDFLERNGY